MCQVEVWCFNMKESNNVTKKYHADLYIDMTNFIRRVPFFIQLIDKWWDNHKTTHGMCVRLTNLHIVLSAICIGWDMPPDTTFSNSLKFNFSIYMQTEKAGSYSKDKQELCNRVLWCCTHVCNAYHMTVISDFHSYTTWSKRIFLTNSYTCAHMCAHTTPWMHGYYSPYVWSGQNTYPLLRSLSIHHGCF